MHFQMVQVVLCAYTLTSTHSSLQLKQGLPLFNQLVSWFTLGLSSPFACCSITDIDSLNYSKVVVYSKINFLTLICFQTQNKIFRRMWVFFCPYNGVQCSFGPQNILCRSKEVIQVWQIFKVIKWYEEPLTLKVFFVCVNLNTFTLPKLHLQRQL